MQMNSLYKKFYISTSPERKTFQFDDGLPALPIPELHSTLEKYLLSTKPFLTEKEYYITKEIVDKFAKSEGKDLQKKLVKYAEGKKNWVENWWLKYAYLSNRLPLVPSCSMIGPEPNHLNEWPPSVENSLKYNCLTVAADLSFYDLLRKETLNPQFSKNNEKLCMNQFRYLFNTSRIPHEGVDDISSYFKTESEGDCPMHIIVLCKGHIWYWYPWTSKGEILPLAELEYQLKFIKERSNSSQPGHGIGALTLDDRDSWAKNRDWLLALSQKNRKNLELVESCIFVFSCLDYEVEDMNQHSQNLFTADPCNRWADKSYASLTSNNGLMGAIGDHSPCEAMMVVILSHYAHCRLEVDLPKTWKSVNELKKGILPYELEFDVDSVIEEGIVAAKETFRKLGNEVRVVLHCFSSYGKDFLKEKGLHPDSFVQCLLQLAFYELHKRLAPTYETATTRRFYRGRTETVRSCTKEVADWIHVMGKETTPIIEKKKKFIKAINRHNASLKECQQAQGIDRHLMGLYLIALENDLPIPDLFTDPAFTKSGGGGNFLLSTSTVGYTKLFGGVMAMVKGGYGIFYSMLPDEFYFFITCYVGSGTCLDGFTNALSRSLHRTKDILNAPDSKI